jgi:hypothetical protein
MYGYTMDCLDKNIEMMMSESKKVNGQVKSLYKARERVCDTLQVSNKFLEHTLEHMQTVQQLQMQI